MHTRFLSVALLLSPALASAGTKLAVMPIEHTGLRPDLVVTLTAVLSVELERTGAFEVVSTADLESILDFERQRDVFACADTTCLAEIGGALGVDRVLRTHIGRVGSAYVLDMTVINIREGRSEARTYQGAVARPEALIGLVRSSVVALVGPDEPLPVAAPALEARSSVANPAAWITAGLGAAVMVTGGVLRQSEGSAGRRLAGDVTLGLGAAVTVAGLVMLGLERSEDSAKDATRVSPTTIGEGLGLVFSGSF